MYTLETLLRELIPYRLETTDIKPINFIFKNEEQLFSDEGKKLLSENKTSLYTLEDKRKIPSSIFISVIRRSPKIYLLQEACVAKDKFGGLVTHRNNVYRPGQAGLYKHCEETIKLITNWNYAFNLIEDIKYELNKLDIEDINKIISQINSLRIRKETRDLEQTN